MRGLTMVAAMLMAMSIHPADARFLSKDPVGPNPQNGANFNRYHYANNNPYRYYDPDGRYVCSGDRAACRSFDKAIAKAQEAAGSQKLSAGQRQALGAAVAFYGKKDEPGIQVSFGKLNGDFAVINTDRQGKGSIKFDVDALSGKSPGGSGLVNGLAMRSLHEGDHGVRIVKYGYPGSKAERLDRERSGYRAEGYYQKATGFLQNSNNLWAPWNSGDGISEGAVGARAEFSVMSSCRDSNEGSCR